MRPRTRPPTNSYCKHWRDEMRADFANTGVVRFAVAYLGNRVTVIRPLDPASSMQPKTTRKQGVVIELHGVDDTGAAVSSNPQTASGPTGARWPPTPSSPRVIDSPYLDLLPVSSGNGGRDVAVLD